MKITRLHYLREMRGGKVACFNAPLASFPRTTMNKNNSNAQKTPLLTHLVAGGTAGFMEACTCHPLDTIKVRMQLSRKAQRSATVSAFYHIKDKNRFTHTHNQGRNLSFLGVGARIVKNESFWALYKGLGAVTAGIVPKMAIRFSSFEMYKGALADENGITSRTGIFFGKQSSHSCITIVAIDTSILTWLFLLLAGLAAGTTEAVCVVSPADLVKIRYAHSEYHVLSSQHH